MIEVVSMTRVDIDRNLREKTDFVDKIIQFKGISPEKDNYLSKIHHTNVQSTSDNNFETSTDENPNLHQISTAATRSATPENFTSRGTLERGNTTSSERRPTQNRSINSNPTSQATLTNNSSYANQSIPVSPVLTETPINDNNNNPANLASSNSQTQMGNSTSIQRSHSVHSSISTSSEGEFPLVEDSRSPERSSFDNLHASSNKRIRVDHQQRDQSESTTSTMKNDENSIGEAEESHSLVDRGRLLPRSLFH